jgi:hypothetical protein
VPLLRTVDGARARRRITASSGDGRCACAIKEPSPRPDTSTTGVPRPDSDEIGSRGDALHRPLCRRTLSVERGEIAGSGRGACFDEFTVAERTHRAGWQIRANGIWRFGRVFFECPECDRLATRLYLPANHLWLACRRCWGLTYDSRQNSYKRTGWAALLGPIGESETYHARERRREPKWRCLESRAWCFARTSRAHLRSVFPGRRFPYARHGRRGTRRRHRSPSRPTGRPWPPRPGVPDARDDAE